MKKVLAVVAVVCVVFAAGAALAQPRTGNDGRRVPPQMTKEFNGEKGHIDQRKAPQFPSESFDRGMVKTVFSGQGDLLKIEIEKDVINPDDKDMLEELILSAVNEGIKASRDLFALKSLRPRSCILTLKQHSRRSRSIRLKHLRFSRRFSRPKVR